MNTPKIPFPQRKPATEITAKSVNRLVLDNLGLVVGKLASSKTEEETGALQELALELMNIQEIKDPGEKLRAFEAVRHKLPASCGCT
ncbi:MAG: hypothetical protein HQK81_15240 [Desulfovibrionaceae bacterium]|nr:hypothetical protein [Desulfovibrionaceae bacterium]MBF0515398.1 hypothetical protein [Desulfovibrionaceae bacterium]